MPINPRLNACLVRGLSSAGSMLWAVATALVAGAVVVGRARPWEGSLAFLLVFARVAALHPAAIALARRGSASGA